MIFDAASALRANATHRPASTAPIRPGGARLEVYIFYVIPARESAATGNGRRV